MTDRIPIPVAFAAFVVAMLAMLPLQNAIIAKQEELQITERSPFEALEPGQFVGTVLIGGFRMVAIDAFWWRYLQRYDQQDFFEMRALADAITTLQPYFEEVWIFHGWMLSYNIALDEPDQEERWKWTEQGLLFMKQGMEYNPRSWRLTYQTAWTYWHRCYAAPGSFSAFAAKKVEANPKLDPFAPPGATTGRNPVAIAADLFEQAAALPDHIPAADYRALNTLEELVLRAWERGDAEEIARLRVRVDARVAHLYEAHGAEISVDFFDRFRDRMNDLFELVTSQPFEGQRPR